MGCTPFWISKNNNNGLVNCTRASELSGFLERVKAAGHMDDKSLFEHFEFLKPCSYMEYQVL